MNFTGILDCPVVSYVILKNVSATAETYLSSFTASLASIFSLFMCWKCEFFSTLFFFFFPADTEHRWNSSKYLVDRFELLYGEIREGCGFLPKLL